MSYEREQDGGEGGFRKPEPEIEIAPFTGKGEANPFIPKFEEFFSTHYRKQIEELVKEYPQKRSVLVDFKDLEAFDYQLADELIEHPDMILEAAKIAAQKIDVPALEIETFSPNIRIRNLPKDRMPLVRDISATHLGKLITVEGVIRQLTDVLPKLKTATWSCKRCSNTYIIEQDGHQLRKPNLCSCKHRDFELVPDQSKFVDYQKIQIQEPLELLKGSEQAVNLDVYIQDDFVNKVAPGDRTQITGMLRLYPPNKDKKAVYGRYLESIHIEETEKEFEEVNVAEEDIVDIKALASNPRIYTMLAESIAPTIYGHNIVKESISLQLFGGVKKTLPGSMTIRGNIHVLLVGDPGTGKCVAGDTLIPLSNGELQPISRVVERLITHNPQVMNDGTYTILQQAIEMPILNGDVKQVKGKAVVAMKRAPERMFQITTQMGKTLKSSHTHPLFVSRDAKVKSMSAEHLKVGEFIATPRVVRVQTEAQRLIPVGKGKTNSNHILFPGKTNFEFGQFVGLLLGEGFSYGKTPSNYFIFTNADSENLELFEQLSQTLFNVRVTQHERKGSVAQYISSNELYRFLQVNAPEMLHSSRERTIPKIIQKSDLATVKGFLQAFLEGEGHIHRARTSGKHDTTIEIASASEQLILELSHLLLRFGIVSNIRKIHRMATNGKRITRPYWRLCIRGAFARKYFEEIGFITERKITSGKENLYGKPLNTNVDVIPHLASELKRIRIALGLSQFNCGIPRTAFQHYERGDRNPSRGQLYLIAQAFFETYTQKELSDIQLQHDIVNLMKLATSDIFWDKVVKTEEIACENFVYDVEVEGTHNFISNLIYSHNSQILQATDRIAPKSVYVSGKTSSGVGLTASAVKDDFGEGGWTLKAGALVLASGGMVMVDEFDKMETEDRSAMHEAMEQGRISVAKAGLVTRFKTDTSVLAGANPKMSRFDAFKPFFEQIDLPPTLISRFDLFFMIRDTLNKERDTAITQHILSTHKAGEQIMQMQREGKFYRTAEQEELEKKVTPIIDTEMLRKYISYARQNVFPVLSVEAVNVIQDFYVGLRDQGRQQGSYAATARQLEGLVRLAEASARIRLSNSVEQEDAERSVRLVRASLEDVVKDPETGRIDIDIVTSGQTQSSRDHMRVILEIIRSKGKEMEKVPIQDVIAEAIERGIDEDKVREFITKLKRSGEIYEPSHGFLKGA